MTDEEFQFLFDRESSLNPFRSFYRSAEDCYKDYARRVTQKYKPHPSVCECCNREGDSSVYVAGWQIRYQSKETTRTNYLLLLLAFAGHIHVSFAYIKFETSHRVCRRCATSARRTRWLLKPLPQLVAILAIGSAAVFFFTSLYLGMMKYYGDIPDPDGVTGCIASGITTALFIPLALLAPRVLVPRFLRPIAKRPVTITEFAEDGNIRLSMPSGNFAR